MKIFYILLFIVIGSSSVFGVTYTFNATSGTRNMAGNRSPTTGVPDAFTGATIETAQSGNWDATNTWVGGAVPLSSQSVKINSGHTVTSAANRILDEEMNVYGTLTFVSIIYGSGIKNIKSGGTLNVGTSSGIGIIDGGLWTIESGATMNTGNSTQIVNSSSVHNYGTVNQTEDFKSFTGAGSLATFINQVGGVFNSSSLFRFLYFTNNGILNKLQGNINSNSGSESFINNGTANINQNCVILSSFANTGSINVVANKTLTIGSVSSSLAKNIGGTFNILGSVVLSGSGATKFLNSFIFKGNGSVSINSHSFTNGSQINPGLSPGKLTFDSDVNYDSSTYNCEINGTEVITDYDHIATTGKATLNNMKLVVDWGNFMPTPGQIFQIMTFGSRVGEFKSVTIPPVSNYIYNLEYEGSYVDLKIFLRYYEDSDGDGFGNPAIFQDSGTPPIGYVLDTTDCDDTNATINPNTTWYQDSDGDTFGNPSVTMSKCEQPIGYVLDNTDCIDTNALLYPNSNIVTSSGSTSTMGEWSNPLGWSCNIPSTTTDSIYISDYKFIDQAAITLNADITISTSGTLVIPSGTLTIGSTANRRNIKLEGGNLTIYPGGKLIIFGQLITSPGSVVENFGSVEIK